MGVVKRQGIKNTVSTYAGFIIGFVNLLIIQPQFLTKEELGLTRILYSVSLLLATFVPLGITNTAIRYFPRFKDVEQRHHGFFGFLLVFPLIGFLLASMLLYLLRDLVMLRYATESPLFNEFFHFVFPLTFFLSFINVLTVYCITNYKSTIPSYLNDVGVRLLTIIVVSLYYLKWMDLDQFILAFCGIYAIQLGILGAYILFFDRPGIRINRKVFTPALVKEMFRYGMILWLAGVASIGLKYFDAIMIGQYLPLAFVGIYTVAAFIPTIIEAPLNAFDKIASSKIASAWQENNREEINSIYRKSGLYLFLAGGFLFLNVNLNIDDLLSFLPEGYQSGGGVVLILSIGSLFNMATGLNGAVLFTSAKYVYGAVFLILLALLLLLFQMWFIPLFGLEGAALATASASLVYNLLLCWFVHRHFGLQPFGRENMIILSLVVVLYGMGSLLPGTGSALLNILYKSALVSVLYTLAVVQLKLAPELLELLRLKKKS